MSKVAIVGSCITRDLWPIVGAEPSDLLYISRTSLPSLFARPLEGVETAQEPPPGLSEPSGGNNFLCQRALMVGHLPMTLVQAPDRAAPGMSHAAIRSARGHVRDKSDGWGKQPGHEVLGAERHATL